MTKLLLIIFREYWTRVRKWSFIIITLLGPFGFALLFIASAFIQDLSDSKKTIYVVDESGDFTDKLKDADDGSLYFKYRDEALDSVKGGLASSPADGLLYIPGDFDPEHPNNIRLFSQKQLGLQAKNFIEGQVSSALKEIRISIYNLDEKALDKLDVNVDVRSVILGEGEQKGYAAIASVIGLISGFLIYMTLFIYGTMVMKGVMEEKTNRIVEVLISSVRPFQLLLGKIIGIGGVGITQFLLWIVLISFTYMGLGIAFSGSMEGFQQMSQGQMGAAQQMNQEEVAAIVESLQSVNFTLIIITFLIYFTGGYLLYGALYAAIGSATNDDGDMQSLTLPVSIPIILSIFIMIKVVNDPHSPLAFWSSLIPFTSPIIMPALVPFGLPWWQIALSVLLLIGGFLLTTWIAAKVYRTGILMYGKKVTFKELGKWVWKA